MLSLMKVEKSYKSKKVILSNCECKSVTLEKCIFTLIYQKIIFLFRGSNVVDICLLFNIKVYLILAKDFGPFRWLPTGPYLCHQMN